MKTIKNSFYDKNLQNGGMLVMFLSFFTLACSKDNIREPCIDSRDIYEGTYTAYQKCVNTWDIYEMKIFQSTKDCNQLIITNLNDYDYFFQYPCDTIIAEMRIDSDYPNDKFVIPHSVTYPCNVSDAVGYIKSDTLIIAIHLIYVDDLLHYNERDCSIIAIKK